MSVISVRTHHDDLLGVFAPIAIAAARSPALVVDLADGGLPLPGTATLADVVSGKVAPASRRRSGVATLPRGDVALEDASSTIDRLCNRWPYVVLRGSEQAGSTPIDVAPDINVISAPSANTLWVRAEMPLRTPSVPSPSRGALLAVLSGRLPHGRWMKPWVVAWEHPWR